jgi:diguanylate cyclase (GGDEF)-like protein
MNNKKRLGFRIFIWAVILISTAYILAYFKNALFSQTRVLSIIGISLSTIVLLIGHFSYTRVHSLKIYLIGYTIGLCGIVYFLSNDQIIFINGSKYNGILYFNMFALINCLSYIAVPSYVKYRLARSITLSICVFEVIALGILSFAPDYLKVLDYLRFNSYLHVYSWIGPSLFIIILLLLQAIKNDGFFIKGIIAGIALFTCVIWFNYYPVSEKFGMQLTMLNLMMIFVITGIMIHWLTRLDYRVSYDPLLQIYNRDFCSKIISEQANVNTSPPFCVAMVDIDHFKNVNDTYGHQAGDAVLYNVAQMVLKIAGPVNGTVCRYGGEELAVFFPNKRCKEVSDIMEQIRKNIEGMITNSGKKKIGVTISSGISERTDSSSSIVDVINAADKALYRAKKGGRNQVKTGKSGVSEKKTRVLSAITDKS